MDGEIAEVDERGRLSLNLRQHQRSSASVALYVFDALIYRGRNLLKEPLTSRRELLSKVAPIGGEAKMKPQM